MKLQIVKNMSKENLLGMVGLQRKNSLQTWLRGSGLVATGLAVGATIALLLTPKSGPEIRGSVLEGLRGLTRRASHAARLTH